MATKMVKVTVSIPRELKSATDEIALEKKVSRSKLVSQCLSQLAQKRQIELLEEGYRAMAEEHKSFAESSAKAASEVVPPWH